MVESLPANAGDTGSSPGLGRSHMPRNNWAREPQLLRLRIWSLCSATREAAIVRGPRTAMKSGPRLPQLEKALTQKRRPNTAINKYINKYLKKKNSISEWQVKRSSGLPLILHYGELCNYFIIHYNVIIIEINCAINVRHLNHPQNIPPAPVCGKIVFHESGP